MKLTKTQLKQIIKEEISKEKPDYWSDDLHRPWDPDLKAINSALVEITLGAIDYYKYESREDAREGITKEIQAVFDNFIDGGTVPDLHDILDEEFPTEGVKEI